MRAARLAGAVSLGATLALAPGCSLNRLAVNTIGNAIARSGSNYASDDDPELIAQAMPFALKTIEGLLETSPRHRGLLLAAASGFTQYAYAFVQCPADYLEATDLAGATRERRRAVKLYLRARDYGMRGLEVAEPDFASTLRRDRTAALQRLHVADVPVLYWTALPWAAAIALDKDDAELTADLPLAAALMQRALDLDERFDLGAIHDFFIAYEGARPAAAGGSRERARDHFERAMQLARGERVAPLVTFAETVSVREQNREEFAKLLHEALAFDVNRAPEQRLANLIAQQRARWLLSRADELFVE
jgi:predicted anti-sigma-YlaC factor YlaD